MTLINDSEQHVGRIADIRCAQHRGLPCGTKRTLLIDFLMSARAIRLGPINAGYECSRSLLTVVPMLNQSIPKLVVIISIPTDL
jgi:hypothetical protein